MAGTWLAEIDVVDLATREVHVRTTRTDGTDVRTYSAVGKYDTSVSTPQELLAHYTALFRDLYEGELAREAQIVGLIGQAETALANALNAQETP